MDEETPRRVPDGASAALDRKIDSIHLSPDSRRYMRVVAAIAAICGGLYGYDTGIISGALLLISKEFHLSSTQQELVASAILAGAVVGALASGWLSLKYGRRTTVKIVTAVFVLGAIACSVSPSVEALILARLFLGFAVGGATQVVPMYISELAPANKRGNMVTMFNVAIGIGILFANIVGFTLTGVWSWRTMIVISALPAAFVFVSMFFLPRSPRWAAEHISMDEAVDILGRVRSSREEIREEVHEIQEVASHTDPATKGWHGIKQPWVRPALVAALGVAFFTQCCGLEMMIYYTPTFLSNVGFGGSAALLSSLGVAVVYAIMTLLGCLYVDRIGRRRLVLITAPGSALALVGLGVMFAVGAQGGGVGGWLVIVFLLLFMMFNSGGIQVVGWLLGSEMFPLGMRGQATSLHAAMLWGSDLLVTGTALTLVQGITLGGTMWFYAAVNLASFLYVWFLVPETAGASLEDIEGALRRGQFRPTPGHTSLAKAA